MAELRIDDADIEDLLGFSLTEAKEAPAPPKRAEQSWGIVGYRYFAVRARFDRYLAGVVDTHGLPDRVVSGGATGADTMAREWAKERGIEFVEHLPATNDREGLLGRNTLIVRDSTMVVAFLSKQSRGTHDTIAKAKKAGKPVVVFHID